MRKSKRLKRFAESFGKVPEVDYYAGDMLNIRSYFDNCRSENRDSFYVDEITWNDLDMDAVFKRINIGLSTSGEQYLYYLLRRPALHQQEFEEQKELICLMEDEPETRLKLQTILQGIGCRRRADINGVLSTGQRISPWLVLYIVLALLVPLSALLVVLHGMAGVPVMVLSITINGLLHEYRKNRCAQGLDTVNHAVALVFALDRIRRLKHPKIDRLFLDAYANMGSLRSVLRVGSISTAAYNDIAEMFMTVFLLDLILYEGLKNRLEKHRAALFSIHRALGQADSAIAIASFRKSLKEFAVPDIDFQAQKPYLKAKQVAHPLLHDPVKNDVDLQRALLVTGANASGKSTYLKAAGLCALLAQSLCTAPCKSYEASVLRLFSSMAISDSILSGDSYYMAEIKSVKRILDAVQIGEAPCLCVIDEVLRGTNTVERIAASSQVLKALAQRNALCIAATHDIELCALLDKSYDQAHFDEEVGEQDVFFDYRLKAGKATSRNAIKLLRLIGFDESIVEQAEESANRYTNTGQWTA